MTSSEDHKAAIEGGFLVSTFGQDWLLSGPILGGFAWLFFLPFSGVCNDEVSANPSTDNSSNKH